MKIKSILIAILLLSTFTQIQINHADSSVENSYWNRCGVVYISPSSPSNPKVQTPDEPPYSWWTQNFTLFETQKEVDNNLISKFLQNNSTKTIILYFPQFLGDTTSYGFTYIKRLETVVDFFYTKGYNVILFLGRPDYNAQGQDIDSVRSEAYESYLVSNIKNIIFYGKIYEDVSEVTLYWMGARYNFGHEPQKYSESEILSFNQAVKKAVNSAGCLFYAHVDGPWWEENCSMNGYTPKSVSPKYNASDGLFAESWAQGSLTHGLSVVIPDYLSASQVILCANLRNYDIDQSWGKTTSDIHSEIDFWFKSIEPLGVKSWVVWDYYDAEAGVPLEFAIIDPKATTLTYKGKLFSEQTKRGGNTAQANLLIITENKSSKPFKLSVNGISIVPPVFLLTNRNSNTIQVLDKEINDGGSRYVFKKWTGAVHSNSTGIELTINRPEKIVMNYETYHEIKVSSEFSEASGSGWYIEGADATISIQHTEVLLDQGKRAVFSTWKGDYAENDVTFTVKVTKPISFGATWKNQHYLTVRSSHGIPTTGSGWFDENTSITVSTATTSDESNDTRYRCMGWIGLGSVSPSGTGNSVTFAITQPSNVTWNWRAQYYLKVDSGKGISPSSGWYDEKTEVSLTTTLKENEKVKNWILDGKTLEPKASLTVTMDKPHNVSIEIEKSGIPGYPVETIIVALGLSLLIITLSRRHPRANTRIEIGNIRTKRPLARE